MVSVWREGKYLGVYGGVVVLAAVGGQVHGLTRAGVFHPEQRRSGQGAGAVEGTRSLSLNQAGFQHKQLPLPPSEEGWWSPPELPSPPPCYWAPFLG